MEWSVPIDPLLARASRREAAASDTGALYREHRQRLVGLAAAITLDRSVAEEVVHDAFVGLQRHAHRVDEPVGYLQRSVVNLSVSLLRRRRVIAAHPLARPEPTGAPEIDDTWQAVTRLSTRARAVVVLRFWQDMTLDDIATTLDWPLGSVKSTLHRALRQLKEDLQ